MTIHSVRTSTGKGICAGRRIAKSVMTTRTSTLVKANSSQVAQVTRAQFIIGSGSQAGPDRKAIVARRHIGSSSRCEE